MVTNTERFRNHRFFGINGLIWGIGTVSTQELFITFDFLAILFIVLGGKFNRYLPVECSKFGFQLILLSLWLCDDGFEQRNILSHFFGTFLILAYDFGETFQSVDKVHAGGFGVAHGDKAVTCTRPQRQNGFAPSQCRR